MTDVGFRQPEYHLMDVQWGPDGVQITYSDPAELEGTGVAQRAISMLVRHQRDDNVDAEMLNLALAVCDLIDAVLEAEEGAPTMLPRKAVPGRLR